MQGDVCSQPRPRTRRRPRQQFSGSALSCQILQGFSHTCIGSKSQTPRPAVAPHGSGQVGPTLRIWSGFRREKVVSKFVITRLNGWSESEEEACPGHEKTTVEQTRKLQHVVRKAYGIYTQRLDCCSRTSRRSSETLTLDPSDKPCCDSTESGCVPAPTSRPCRQQLTRVGQI